MLSTVESAILTTSFIFGGNRRYKKFFSSQKMESELRIPNKFINDLERVLSGAVDF